MQPMLPVTMACAPVLRMLRALRSPICARQFRLLQIVRPRRPTAKFAFGISTMRRLGIAASRRRGGAVTPCAWAR
jgi:hypothetical protein